jgi:hypothetical protein
MPILHPFAGKSICKNKTAHLLRQAAASLHVSGLLLRQAATETSDPVHARHLVRLSVVAQKAAEPLRRMGRSLEVRGV